MSKQIEPMTGYEILRPLAEKAGIGHLPLRRMIIDIPIDGVVKVYYETIADKEVFADALLTLVSRAKVETLERS